MAGPAKQHRLTRDELVAARVRKTEDVPTPELGEGSFLTVRGMKTGEQALLAEFMDTNPSAGELTVGIAGFRIMFWKCVVDGDGNPMFGGEDQDVADDFDFDLVQRVGDVVMRLSGMDKDEIKAIAGKAPSAASGGDSVTV